MKFPNSPLLKGDSEKWSPDWLNDELDKYSISLQDLADFHEEFSVASEERQRPRFFINGAAPTNWNQACTTIGNAVFQSLKLRRPSIMKKLLHSAGYDTKLIDETFKFREKCVKSKVRRRLKPGCERIRSSRMISESVVPSLSKRQQSLIIGKKTQERIIISRRKIKNKKGAQKTYITRRTLCGRSINLRLQVEQSITKLKSLGFNGNKLDIEMWLDGSELAKMPTVMVCWKFMFDESLLNISDEILHELRRPHICCLVPGHENREDLSLVFKDILCPQIRDLEESNVNDVEVLLKLFLCDNKATQTIMGLNNGLFPCCCCYTSRSKFHSYVCGHKSPLRNLNKIYDRVNSSEEILKFGDCLIPLLFDEKGLCAKLVSIGVDTLHIIENVGTRLLCFALGTVTCKKTVSELLAATIPSMKVTWDGEIAVVSNTTCSNIRDLFMMFEHIFVPNSVWRGIQEEKYKAILQAMSAFRDVICLLYANPIERKSILVFRLFVSVFIFSTSLQVAFPPSKTTSSLYSLPQWLLHTHFKNLLREKFGCSDIRLPFGAKNNYEATVAQLFKPFTINTFLTLINDQFSEETKCLLWHLADYKLNSWYHLNVDNSITFFRATPSTEPDDISHNSEQYRKDLLTQYQNNPIQYLIPGFSYDNLDDALTSTSIDPGNLRKQDCIVVLCYRKLKVHDGDCRSKLLSHQYVSGDGLGTKEIFSVDILRKKLETDNMIISFREKMNLMVPETNDAIAWQHFTEQEAVLMQRKSIFIPQFEVPDFVETPLPPGNKRDRSYWEKITVNRMKREAKKRRMSAKGNKCKADWIGTMVDHFD